MEDKDKAIARAKRLEEKMLFVKAAEAYLSVSMKEEAAKAYERGGAYDKAIELFGALGKKEEAERCRKKRDESSTGKTWMDMQSDFQHDAGNPY
jgi:hypothetical protein